MAAQGTSPGDGCAPSSIGHLRVGRSCPGHAIVNSPTGRTSLARDLTLAVQLADRAASAIDNARLYHHQQEVSRTLQRSLMPKSLPSVPGLSVAARYLAASEGSEVGGDWYDLVPMPTGRVAVVIGDVMGRGVAAAALMGQVRAALRAYAGQDLPPAEVLTHADELIRGLAEDTIVTCVYGVYDPREERLVLSNAGHVPPLLVDPAPSVEPVPAAAIPARSLGRDEPHLGGGTTAPVPGVTRFDAAGPPLGTAGPEPYRHVTIDLPAGRLLALYTDGLVESRDSDIEAGVDLLARELREPHADLERTCEAVLTGIRPTGTDDTALLLLRPERTTRPRVASLTVSSHAADVRQCREFAVDTLTGWGEDPETALTAELVVSELVTNSVRYARPPLSLLLSVPESGVVVEVRDHGGTAPRLRSAAPDDEGGRGLMIVATLAFRWGTRLLPDGGKAVWCCLGRSGR